MDVVGRQAADDLVCIMWHNLRFIFIQYGIKEIK